MCLCYVKFIPHLSAELFIKFGVESNFIILVKQFYEFDKGSQSVFRSM